MRLLLGCVSPPASLIKCESEQLFNVFSTAPTAPVTHEPKIEIVKTLTSFTSACPVASVSCPNQVVHLISPDEFQSEDAQGLPASSGTIAREPESAFFAVEPENEFFAVDTEDVTLADQVDCEVNGVSAPTESDNRDGDREVLALPSVSLKNNGSIDGDSNSEYYNCLSDTASTTSSNRANVTVVRPQENPVQPQPETKLKWEMPAVYSNDPVSTVRIEEVSHMLVIHFFPTLKTVFFYSK